MALYFIPLFELLSITTEAAMKPPSEKPVCVTSLILVQSTLSKAIFYRFNASFMMFGRNDINNSISAIIFPRLYSVPR